MKLYIAGPMSGLPEYNRPAFFEAEQQLTEAGFEVINPARNVLPGAEDMNEYQVWLGYMRLSLPQIAECDGIAKLDGWENSKGAKIEVNLALSLGLPVSTPQDWAYILRYYFSDSGRVWA